MTRNESRVIVDVEVAHFTPHHADPSYSSVASSALPSIPQEFSMRDYLLAREKLQYEAMYFPLGFPVRVLSNVPAVFTAANQSWSSFQPVFHREPLEVLVKVSNGYGHLPPAPAHTLRGDTLLQYADPDNFLITDLKRGLSLIQINQTAAHAEKYFRYHLLEAAALSMVTAMRAVAIHGACVRVAGRGVLFCGDSGEGKSTLAYAGSRAGWTYVTDDATYIPIDRLDRLAVGNCHQVRFRPSAVELFPELTGLPITPRAAGKPSIEVRTLGWPVISTANAAFIDHVVFLNRKCIDTQELIPLQAGTVLPWFEQHLMSTTDSRAAQEAALARLLSARIYELRYTDLNLAIDRVSQLAMKGN
jgi:hypothetical protein